MLAQVLAVPVVVIANSMPITPIEVGEAVGSKIFAEFGLPHGPLIVLVERLVVYTLSIPDVFAMSGCPKEN